MFGRMFAISGRKRFIAIGAVVLIAAVVWRFLAVPVEINAAPILKSPTQSPPLGSSPALNTSESFQTKSGALTLGDGLTISDPAGNPDLVVGTGQICWNTVCKSDWNDVAGLYQRYVQLNVAASGWVSVLGLNAIPSTQPAALKFTASVPAAVSPSTAVWGEDKLGTNPSFPSAGVYAQAGADSTNNLALYGNAEPSTLEWSGYFSGNVAVEGPFDFLVGGALASGTDSSKGELCIRDTCRSSWPSPTEGDLYWFDSGTLLQPVDTTLNLAIGGNNASAPFYLQNLSAQSEVQLRVKGTGTVATKPGTSVVIRTVDYNE